MIRAGRRWGQSRPQPQRLLSRRCQHNQAPEEPEQSTLLRQPSWSVRSLLPSTSATGENADISSTQLHHLFRLSALPPPATADDEKKIMSTLSAQLHFVREVQSVDTTGVEPLRSIRDETPEAYRETEVTLETVQPFLGKEEIRGWNRRIRRKKDAILEENEAEGWDVLGHASRTVGRYFVVEVEDSSKK
ncbi:MAG: hypothetical protein M1815_001020 [Lichina confinis]|nr:MAG: hypothetical protein M1815_001020 [Lichina confinis]